VEDMPIIFSVEESKKSVWVRTPFADGVTFFICAERETAYLSVE
jgi:hypothetical protein